MEASPYMHGWSKGGKKVLIDHGLWKALTRFLFYHDGGVLHVAV
jgi:hypothetical protein